MPIIPHIGVVFSYVEWLSFWFLDGIEESANIFAAIKSGSTVLVVGILAGHRVLLTVTCHHNLSEFTPI